ncbi:hypothetical protein [Sphingopyxis flava]|uniref:Uncharacterized protein n=1 Tax=Sphingopyxis flava TaxID=1507287 RepID=A0A1T5BRY6_9SPHN|nr:hypothetical protein [Sphingopyxis flava]SKB49934.1 hypothetical protein SAMN06295937_100788 [Sphingopyxis flava]
MTTITLADATTGVGSISKIDQFANVSDEGVKAKDRYALHVVDPFVRDFLGVRSERIDAAVRGAGVDPERVFYEIIRLGEEDYASAKDEDGLPLDLADRAEEIWVAAFGDDNDPEGVHLKDVNFIRVA